MYPDIKEASRQWFAASTTHMDDGFGKIVTALDEAGLRELGPAVVEIARAEGFEAHARAMENRLSGD